MNSYPAFVPFPAVAGTTSPIRYTPDAGNGGSIRITLAGTAFTVRVQVSNERATGGIGVAATFSPTGGAQTLTDSQFAPSTWDNYATIVAADPPLTIPGPVRFVRLIIDSGQVDGGTVLEDETRGPPADARILTLATNAGAAAGTAAGTQTIAQVRTDDQLRHGLNILDYANLCPGYTTAAATNTVTDWAPALNAMNAAATPQAVVTIPSGNYTILNQWNITKPLTFDCKGAVLNATGANFTTGLITRPGTGPGSVAPTRGQYGYWDPFEYATPRPAINITTTLGNGSFGDNIMFGAWSVLRGVLPAVQRVGNTGNLLRDGSIGVYICNAYYPILDFQPINEFHRGVVIAGGTTGSGQRGTSHGQFTFSRLGNVINLTLIGREDTGPTAGWVTANRFTKGGFGTPSFTITNPANPSTAEVPDDHVHVVSIGKVIGWNYANTLVEPYFEGYAVQGYLAIGAQQLNGLSIPAGVGTELKMPPLRGKRAIELVNDTLTPTGQPYLMRFDGVPALKITDGGGDTTSEFRTFAGSASTFAGRTLVRDARNGSNPSIDSGTEWEPLGAFNAQYVSYTGTAITLDLSLSRRWLIQPTVNMPINAVSFINPPTMTTNIDVLIQQPAGGVTVADGWLNSARFGRNARTPVNRAGGFDQWLLSTAFTSQTGIYMVSAHTADANVTASVLTSLTATATLTFPSVPAQGQQELTITLTGAAINDPVNLGRPAFVDSGLIMTARVTAVNIVTVRCDNKTAAAIVPTSGFYTVQIVK